MTGSLVFLAVIYISVNDETFVPTVSARGEAKLVSIQVFSDLAREVSRYLRRSFKPE
jgi:hypothetical protein